MRAAGLLLRLVESLPPLRLLGEADPLQVLLGPRTRVRVDLAYVLVHLPGRAFGVIGPVFGLLGQGQGPGLLLARLFGGLVGLPEQ